MREASTRLHGVGDLARRRSRRVARQRLVLAHEEPAVDEPADDLLQEERVALRALEDPRVHRRREVVDREQQRDRRSASSAVSGSSATAEALRRPPPQPAGARVRSGRDGTQEQRRSLDAVGELLQQVEQRGVGPVDVLDDDDERRGRAASAEKNERQAACELVADLAAGPRPRTAISGSSRPTVYASAAVRASGSAATSAVSSVRPSLADLLEGELRRVGVQDAGVALEDLGERPVGDAVAVGEAPTLQRPAAPAPAASAHARNSRVSRLLPTPALAVDRDEVGPALRGDRAR